MARTSKKHPSNISSKKRKTKPKKSPATFDEENRTTLSLLDKGSFYDQQGCLDQEKIALAQIDKTTPTSSSSKRKLDWANDSDSDDSTSGDSSDGADKSSEEDDNNVFCERGGKTFELKKPQHLWIIDIRDMDHYLSREVVCKECHGPVSVYEEAQARAGLGTKLQIRCLDHGCASNIDKQSFDTTKKTGHSYDINLINVLANRSIGKGQAASDKYCSIMGLAPPIKREYWTNKTNVILKRYKI